MSHLGSAICEASGEQTKVGEEEPCGGAGGGGLEVFGKASTATEPGKGALDHPLSRQELEAFDARRSLHNLDAPGAAIGDRLLQLLATIDAVGEDMVQFRESLPQRPQQRHGAMRVLDIGGMDLGSEHKALRVGDDVALAPLDALAGVDPARAAAFGCRYALAVDDAGGRHRIAPSLPTRLGDQRQTDPLPGAIVAPAVKVSLHCRVRRKLSWQGAPRAAGPQ